MKTKKNELITEARQRWLESQRNLNDPNRVTTAHVVGEFDQDIIMDLREIPSAFETTRRGGCRLIDECGVQFEIDCISGD